MIEFDPFLLYFQFPLRPRLLARIRIELSIFLFVVLLEGRVLGWICCFRGFANVAGLEWPLSSPDVAVGRSMHMMCILYTNLTLNFQ